MEEALVATAWNNGSYYTSGAGYGLKVSVLDRDKHFKREWGSVELHLPARDQPVRVNIEKDSFWGPTCRELINSEIGRWLLGIGAAPWPQGAPPRILLTPAGTGVFQVRLASARS